MAFIAFRFGLTKWEDLIYINVQFIVHLIIMLYWCCAQTETEYTNQTSSPTWALLKHDETCGRCNIGSVMYIRVLNKARILISCLNCISSSFNFSHRQPALQSSTDTKNIFQSKNWRAQLKVTHHNVCEFSSFCFCKLNAGENFEMFRLTSPLLSYWADHRQLVEWSLL